MTELPIFNNSKDQLLLKAKIKILQQELSELEVKISSFEAELRVHLINEIIEEQELTILYKKIKKAKKENRTLQKKKGKNYNEVKGLKIVSNKTKNSVDVNDQKELKRLYREAMFYVHPDKFSMNDEKNDLATEITTKLIDIYKNGNLEELQVIHNHILSGNSLLNTKNESTNYGWTKKDTYLEKEIEKLISQIETKKKKDIFKVITEYKNPLTFIDELKEYYEDRIFKLKKRTRKAYKYGL